MSKRVLVSVMGGTEHCANPPLLAAETICVE